MVPAYLIMRVNVPPAQLVMGANVLPSVQQLQKVEARSKIIVTWHSPPEASSTPRNTSPPKVGKIP